MAIKIEGASLRYLDELYVIEQQSFKEEAFSKHQIAYLLAEYNAISLVARINGEIAGFIIGRIEMEDKLIAGHILTIDVLPNHRRKGISQQLLGEIEAIFRKEGAVECRLEVREDNAAALSLYQKLGYQKVARLEQYYGETHGLYLRKTLE